MRKRFASSRGIRICEALECRRLLSANLHVNDVELVDQNANVISSPYVGQQAFLRVDFTTTDLPSNASYTISHTLYGTTYNDTALTWGAGLTGTYSWYEYYGAWGLQPGQATGVVTLDSQNTVTETNEADNSGQVTFTAVQLPLQAKLATPLGGVGFRNYGIVNYVDQDPSSPGFADYRGGPYTYDTHDAIDFSFPSFAALDAGTPVMAAEAGTVVSVADGNYDRNTVGTPYANYIEIDSGNGYQEYYYHLRDGSVGVQVGQTVVQGQVIGLVGSSGNSSGTHLHFAVYNGTAVETYENPYKYWQNPLPYQGDVDSVIDSGVTNYDPSAILNTEERPPNYTNFGQQSGQTAYAWFTTFVQANESGTITFYRPNATVYSSFNFNTGSSPVRGGYWYGSTNLPSVPDAGIWQAAITVNGVELARDSFNVTSAPASGAVVTDGSIVANGRTTPIDDGTYSLNQAASVLSLTIKDYGRAALTLGSLSLPVGWLVTSALPGSLAAGASAVLGIEVDTSIAGYRYGWVSIPTNDPNSPNYTFAVSGTVNAASNAKVVSLYSRDTQASEQGLQPGVFRLWRTGDTSQPLTVQLSIGGTATNGSDYNTIPASATFAAGASETSVIITPVDDSLVEGNETVILSLAAGSGYQIGPDTSAVVSIADNDGTGTGSISGTVYLDRNFNTYRDSGELGIQGIALFLDTNSDGIWESGEPAVATLANGSYMFTGLVAGRYNVREMPGQNDIFTTPVGSYTVTAGGALPGVNFGAFPTIYTGTSAGDSISISPGSTGGRFNVSINGTVYSGLRSQVPTLTILGDGGSDAIAIDLSSGGPFTSQTVDFDGNGGTDSVSITNAHVVFISSQTLSALTISGGLVDIGSGSIALNYGSGNTSPISTIRGYLQSAYNKGAWQGATGLTSSAVIGQVAANKGTTNGLWSIGYADGNVDGKAGGVVANQILISPQLVADATEDGKVDFNDLLAIAQNNGSITADWVHGDFNFDGAVDFNDLLLLAQNINKTNGNTPLTAELSAVLAVDVAAPAQAAVNPLFSRVAIAPPASTTDRLTPRIALLKRHRRLLVG